MRYLDLIADINPAVTLSRQDLITREGWLKNAVYSFLPFKSYSLYFPESVPPEMAPQGVGKSFSPVYIQKEKKLLLPLVLRGELLAVFLAREVRVPYARFTAPYLAQMAEFCLEELLLRKMAVTDPLTNLPNNLQLRRRLGQAVKSVRGSAEVEEPGCADGSPRHMASFGVIQLCPASFQSMCGRFGLKFAEMVMRESALLLDGRYPPPMLATRLDEDSFCLFMPDASVAACRQAAEALAGLVAELRFAHEVTGEVLKLSPAVGFACYPQDMSGRDFERAADEQSIILLSRLAAAVETSRSHGRVFGFSQIMEEGGRITGLPEANRVLVDLGRSVGASEGRRFKVLNQDMAGRPVFKGEVMLTAVHEDESLAEILDLADSADPITVGDNLQLLDWQAMSEHEAILPGSDAGKADPLTGLYAYRDFFTRLNLRSQKESVFTLALIRLVGPAGRTGDAPVDEDRIAAGGYDREAAFLTNELRALLGPELLGGRHSQRGVFFFHPGLSAEEVSAVYADIKERLRRDHGLDIAVGLAGFPFLDYRKTDMLDNALKALDYAMLLPEPRIGLFGTLALNINADRLFSRGDLYGALEEYKAALLVDDSNQMARNSLAICLARLDRLPQARQELETVVAANPKDAMAAYNLACICLKLGDIPMARKYFAKTLRLSPGHVYSLIRLGQLAETNGRFAQARKYYLQAASSEEGAALTYRPLAQLAIRRGEYEQAREYLHQALSQDPNDAAALHLLARIYLDQGEDAEIAEVLARQSVALQPGRKLYWLELIRALEIRGKSEEVRIAKLRLADLP